MKTWKKIEDTRKRTNEIVSLKNRNDDRIRQVSSFSDFVEHLVFTCCFDRKNERCKRRLNLNDINLLRTTWFRSSVLRRNLRSKKPYSCLRPRKRSRQRSLGRRTSNRFATMNSRSKPRTRWRTRSLISRSVWRRWRSRRNRGARFKWPNAIRSRRHQWRRLCARPRKTRC
jgi:hypothetical protein